jgi:hypothetical protein
MKTHIINFCHIYKIDNSSNSFTNMEKIHYIVVVLLLSVVLKEVGLYDRSSHLSNLENFDPLEVCCIFISMALRRLVWGLEG